MWPDDPTDDDRAVLAYYEANFHERLTERGVKAANWALLEAPAVPSPNTAISKKSFLEKSRPTLDRDCTRETAVAPGVSVRS